MVRTLIIGNSKSAQRKYHLVMLAVLLIVLVSLAIYDYYFSKPKTPTKDNLKELALSAEDVKGYSLLNESSQLLAYKDAIASYAVIFGNKGNDTTDYGNYKKISNTILLYGSSDDSKKYFAREISSKMLPGFGEIRIRDIGEESIAFSGDLFGQKRTSLWFRKKNAIANIYMVNFNTDEAVLYAQKVEGKIK